MSNRRERGSGCLTVALLVAGTILPALVACGRSGAAHQDGAAATAAPLAFPTGPWQDPATGLTWENPADPKPRDLAQSEAYCDALAAGGFHDWRLPTITELRSLIRGCPSTMTGGMCPVDDGYAGPRTDFCSPDRQPEAPGRDGCYCAPELAGSIDDYWSSSLVQGDEGLRWVVSFRWTAVNILTRRSLAYVRCVRGEKMSPPVPCTAEQHREAGKCVTDPPWTDPATGLTWESLPHGQEADWAGAVAYCDGLVLHGHDDWRLPTYEELRTLIRNCPRTRSGSTCGATGGATDQMRDDCQCAINGGPRRDGCFLPTELQGLCRSTWSATPSVEVADDAWALNFYYAAPMRSAKMHSFTVRCVYGISRP
ncbi:MAG: DUF1566 domain-containing protein [Deltaproteobacteria bacterium]|nr:DUF1566 domain-containing protein [Deltaproteobacteria bacterium]